MRPDQWILEGILTTLPRADARPEDAHIAPMGPIVDSSMSSFVLRPFRTSTTYQNLRETGEGVFHVTDDILLVARAAMGRVRPGPPAVRGFRRAPSPSARVTST